jgi:hypothetical protein
LNLRRAIRRCRDGDLAAKSARKPILASSDRMEHWRRQEINSSKRYEYRRRFPQLDFSHRQPRKKFGAITVYL